MARMPEGSFGTGSGLEEAVSIIRNLLQTPPLINSLSNTSTTTQQRHSAAVEHELSALLTPGSSRVGLGSNMLTTSNSSSSTRPSFGTTPYSSASSSSSATGSSSYVPRYETRSTYSTWKAKPRQRFREGLRTLSVLENNQKHPDSFRPVLCFCPKPLTADDVDSIFEIRYSEEGSNKRQAEERLVAWWRDYLQDIEEEADGAKKLGGILAFATGSDSVPPVGFAPQPSLDFLHHSGPQRFPTANTCINCLRLPIYGTYLEFKDPRTSEAPPSSPSFLLAKKIFFSNSFV